jgi:hypothetical protein
MKVKVLLLLLLMIPTLAFSEVGVVVKALRYKFAIEADSGYLLVEWREGYMPSLGDLYTGSFKGQGNRLLYCSSVNMKTRFWINNYYASEEDVYNYFKDDYHAFDSPAEYLK